jgi:hypothetical protein
MTVIYDCTATWTLWPRFGFRRHTHHCTLAASPHTRHECACGSTFTWHWSKPWH